MLNLNAFYTDEFWYERYGFAPGSNVWHTVDVAIKWVVSKMPGTKKKKILNFKKLTEPEVNPFKSSIINHKITK